MFAGVDVGALTAEAVILGDGNIVSYSILDTGSNSKKAGEEALERALSKAGRREKDLKYIVGTGYGRVSLPFVDKVITEISCHAKGAHYLNPATEMVIDIGGQDSKVIVVDSNGKVADFAMNEKCAAGTGRFLEVMAKALDVKLDELGALSLDAVPVSISSMCTVFAESEVISLLASETPKERIAAGLHKSIAERITAMVYRVGLREKVFFSGGVAKNRGMKLALEKSLKVPLFVPPEPQIVGALGAALLASEEEHGEG